MEIHMARLPATSLALLLTATPGLAQELNALVWCDHTDPALIEPFEQRFGVKVNLKEYEGTAAGLAGWRSSECTRPVTACGIPPPRTSRVKRSEYQPRSPRQP